jgi:WD40 repeat protein
MGKKLTVLCLVVAVLVLVTGYMLVGNPFQINSATSATQPNVEPFKMPKPAREFDVIAPNGQKFRAQVFDLPGEKPKELPPRKERVSAFGTTKDGQLLQADLDGSKILVGDPVARRITHTIKTPQKDVFRLEFSIEGAMIASMNSTSLVLWDIESGKQTLKIEGSFEKSETIAFSEEKGKIGVLKFSEDRKASVRKWDIKTGKPIEEE